MSYYDAESDKRLRLLTNNFTLPALTIAQIHKCRGQVALSFKWIKQHLRIKAFYCVGENRCREDADLDCGVGVRTGGDRTEAVGPGGQFVSHPTDSERVAFRENAHFMRPSGHRR
ncbi:MAG: transposase [Acidobacteriia bacterium]|nr:transposase [Terriglobia bacterium]